MKRNNLKLVIWLFIIGVGVFVLQYFDLTQFTPDKIQAFILSFGVWAPILYIFLYAVRPLFFFPALILTLTGGLTFGPFWGTLYDLIGASLGAYLAFGISRWLGRDTVRKLIGKRLQSFEAQADKYGFRTILFLRLVPLVPFDVINYGAGLTKIRFRDYAIATTIGIIPGAFAFNYLGSSLHHIFSPTFFVAVGFVVLLSITPLIYKKWRTKKNEDE
ncbi:TVP38/TMEM64 family protein [Hazenella sp. IB182357]|uniref:TVP38/TMEM64 family membrane protein n=1 Tax=Polycladospora coralii TaxID=2771432 RepID=A0A926NCX2_9BACL|nr:TVP38/TMEM64 family protein [Polycladospora coralii]MBD1373070.1 TVP38/TMEM64 family protein [Polycladospora coralii]